MKYRELGNTGMKFSEIAFGAWQIGGAPFWESKGDKVSKEAIEAALVSDINIFDTAPVYGFGRSEELIGEVLKPHRDNIFIATKCGLRWKKEDLSTLYRDLKPKSIREEVEISLRRLKTDRIDLYQIHWPSSDDPIGPTMDELAKLKHEQKIMAIGVSNFDLPLLREAVKIAPVDSIQPKYNLLERDIENELLPFCREEGIGVLAYSPLASGLLSGKYNSASTFADWRGKGNMGLFKKDKLGDAFKRVGKLAHIAEERGENLLHLALNWVLANKTITSALVGVKDGEQLKQNVMALSKPLSDDLKEELESV